MCTSLNYPWHRSKACARRYITLGVSLCTLQNYPWHQSRAAKLPSQRLVQNTKLTMTSVKGMPTVFLSTLHAVRLGSKPKTCRMYIPVQQHMTQKLLSASVKMLAECVPVKHVSIKVTLCVSQMSAECVPSNSASIKATFYVSQMLPECVPIKGASIKVTLSVSQIHVSQVENH